MELQIIDRSIRYITVATIILLAFWLDGAHAYLTYDIAPRMPIFFEIVFGDDMTRKLLLASLFAVLIGGASLPPIFIRSHEE